MASACSVCQYNAASPGWLSSLARAAAVLAAAVCAVSEHTVLLLHEPNGSSFCSSILMSGARSRQVDTSSCADSHVSHPLCEVVALMGDGEMHICCGLIHQCSALAFAAGPFTGLEQMALLADCKPSRQMKLNTVRETVLHYDVFLLIDHVHCATLCRSLHRPGAHGPAGGPHALAAAAPHAAARAAGRATSSFRLAAAAGRQRTVARCGTSSRGRRRK